MTLRMFVSTCTLVTCTLAASAHATDYLMTVSGPYRSFANDGTAYDGTTTTSLPPLFNIPQLEGGTFSATFRFRTVTALTGSFAVYFFDQPAGLTYDLFNASGTIVHRGTSPSSAGTSVFDNSAGPTITTDGVTLFSFVNNVTNLITPVPLYTPPGEVGAVSSAIAFSGEVSSSTNYITGLGIPTDAAIFAAFPNRRFSASMYFGDGDFLDQSDPFQYIESTVSYEITNVAITPIPAPGAASILALGGLVAPRRRRRQ